VLHCGNSIEKNSSAFADSMVVLGAIRDEFALVRQGFETGALTN
jgi:hypothetical protein